MKGAKGKYFLVVSGVLFIILGGYLFFPLFIDFFNYARISLRHPQLLTSFVNLVLPFIYLYTGYLGVRRRDELYYSGRQIIFAAIIIVMSLFYLIYWGNPLFRGGIHHFLGEVMMLSGFSRLFFFSENILIGNILIENYLIYVILIAISSLYLIGAQKNK